MSEAVGATTEPIEFDLDDELNVVAGHLNALHGQLVDVVIRMIASPRDWRGPGVHTAELFLAWRTGLSAQRARQIVTIAERADELPECVAAFRRGELAIDQMAAIAKRAPWWIDTEICELGRMLTVHQLTRTLGTYPFPDHPHPDTLHPEPVDANIATAEAEAVTAAADAVVAEASVDTSTPVPVEPAPRDRMWFGVGDDGRFRLHVETDALTGMTIDAALREARDRLFDAGHPDIDWTDALRDVCERSLDTITEPARRDRYRIHVHLDTNGTSRDDHGATLPDAARRHITCDGLITPTLIEGSVPISVGRTSRVVPQRTRRHVILRDGGCAIPGCTHTHVLEVHHITHWENGGPTDTANLIALCPHHHRMHHRGELGIIGNPDEGAIVFTDCNGQPIQLTGAKPKPPGAPPPPPPGRYAHPLGERLDTNYLYFREPDTRNPSRAA